MSKPSVIVSVNNIAGVVKKVTLASDLAINLSKNYRVLLVDLDPKGVLANTNFGTKGVELQESFINETIRINSLKSNLFILQGSTQLTSLIPEVTKYYGEHRNLSRIFNRRELSLFDYIILDTLSILKYITISAFIASNYIFIPLLSINLEVLNNLLSFIQNVLENHCLNTKVYGLIVNEENLTIPQLEDRKAELEEELNIKILDSYYPMNIFDEMQVKLSKEPLKLINSKRQPKAVTAICNEIINNLRGDNHE